LYAQPQALANEPVARSNVFLLSAVSKRLIEGVGRMTAVAEIVQFLDEFAPLTLAADWDNVGLLLGERGQDVHRVMTCLT
jgi:hypothetical protein